MTLEALIAFNLALLAALASPGPGLLVFVRTTLAQGRRAGIATGLGLGAMAALWTLAALVGLNAVFTLFPAGRIALRTLGAAYLIWIAWTTWRDAGQAPGAAPARPAGRIFASGVLINLGNPKSVLFAAAVLVVIFPQGLDGAWKAVVVLNHFALEAAFYTSLAIVLSRPAASRAYLGARTALDRVAAMVLGGLGLRLLLER